eukprot:TRINITY_DN68264_c0_g1_i1.p1 TRINITY_DN68264_c0_g1~~TRINITY_DN68264_c0_g1_i1.p1  ORF type:complete len:475 (-),score=46.05 TRINITY_DN68264_c0_g1_i1:39-1463(-)
MMSRPTHDERLLPEEDSTESSDNATLPMPTLVHPSSESMTLAEKALAACTVLIWLFAWFGLWALIAHGHGSPYMLAMALGCHVRFTPPLGQSLPAPDPLLLFVWAWSIPLAGVCVAGAALSHSLLAIVCWAASAVSLAVATYFRCESVLAVRKSFEDLGLQPSPRPSEPWLTQLYRYAYFFYSDLPGTRPNKRVVISRIKADDEARHSALDVWTTGPSAERRPVFFFIHGGGWRGGHLRATPQAPLLQCLAAQGWFVVSAEYRKSSWPQQLEDTLEAFKWVCSEEAARLGADADKIVVAGGSAGGHLATLLTYRMLKDEAYAKRLKANALIYPALDPRDVTQSTMTSPICIPCLRLSYGQSLLAWFFELLVLRCQPELWPEASPLQLIQQNPATAKNWPPTLILHGERDSVVPLIHGETLLEITAAARGVRRREEDTLIRVPGARHTFDLTASSTASACHDGIAAWLNHERLRW